MSYLLALADSDLIHWLEQVLATPLMVNACTNANKDSDKENDSELTLGSILSDKVLKEAEFYFPLENADAKTLSQLLLAHRKSGDMSQEKQQTSAMMSYSQPLMIGFLSPVKGHDAWFYRSYL